MTRMTRLIRGSLLPALSAALSACTPASITFTFGYDRSRLEETTVIGSGSDGPKVALIDVRGLIIDAERSGLFQQGANPVDELVARLNKAATDSDVRAVLLRVNSAGGAVTASDTMYRELVRFREATGKPLVVTMSEIAASGGYYIALAADEIFAQPTTITGSIGVIIPTINVSEGLGRIGIVSRSIKSGRNKDIANPLEPMRDSQYAILQELVDRMYARFRNLVIERRGSRGLAVADADTLMDGRVMTGDEALRAGLVDSVGDLHDAFNAARKRAGLGRARLVKYHAEGDRPRTAYAMDATPVPVMGSGGIPQGTEINVLKVSLGGAGVPGSGVAYYLWLPDDLLR